MDKEIRNSNKDVNFYRLNKAKPFKVEGAGGGSSYLFIIFSCVYLTAIVCFCILYRETLFTDIESTVVPIGLLVFGLVFLIIGIWLTGKNKLQHKKEQEIFENCTLTDGKVEYYSCIEKINHKTSDNNTSYSYEVAIRYSFIDTNFMRRETFYENTYSYDPQFYEGQYLMIAFNDIDSLILNRFTLKGEDEKKFKEAEDERSEDDFDAVTGEIVSVDRTKKIISAEFSYVYIIATLSLIAVSVLVAVPLGAVALPTVVATSNSFAITIMVIFGLCAPLLMFLIPAGIFLVCGLKKKKHFNNIMKNEPKFTFGKIFASEKTFRKGHVKRVLYCYIDEAGTKHKKNTTSPVLLKKIQGKDIDVMVVYDKLGNSEVIYNYTETEIIRKPKTVKSQGESNDIEYDN